MEFAQISDAQSEGVRLEIIQQDIYDTQYQMNPFWFPKKQRKKMLETPPNVTFFQGGPFNPGWDPAMTNVNTQGQLACPKRVFVCGLSFRFDAPLDKDTVNGLSACVRVGEKNYFVHPLAGFEECRRDVDHDYAFFKQMIADLSEREEREGIKGFCPPVGSIYIPPVQNFSVILETNGIPLGEIEIRCSLIGMLAREIQ